MPQWLWALHGFVIIAKCGELTLHLFLIKTPLLGCINQISPHWRQLATNKRTGRSKWSPARARPRAPGPPPSALRLSAATPYALRPPHSALRPGAQTPSAPGADTPPALAPKRPPPRRRPSSTQPAAGLLRVRFPLGVRGSDRTRPPPILAPISRSSRPLPIPRALSRPPRFRQVGLAPPPRPRTRAPAPGLPPPAGAHPAGGRGAGWPCSRRLRAAFRECCWLLAVGLPIAR